MEVAILLGGVLIAIGTFMGLCIAAFKGAVLLFEFAAEQGFVGLAAYLACWFFLFPAMLIICTILGLSRLWKGS